MQTNNGNATSLLSSKAVLIRLFTSAFIGNPCDKQLTAEVQNSHGTEDKRVSVRKKIMQGKELNAIAATLQNVRKLAEKLSAPWLDGGLRIVPAKSLIATKLEIEKGIRDFEAKVDDFIFAYDDIIAKDRIALNGTFRESDYMTPSKLRTKFSARLEIFPIPSDFRVEGIDAAVKADLELEMDKLTNQRISEAKADLLSRIQDKVSHLIGKLENMTDETRLHASLVNNVSEACAEVRAANFDEDQTLNDLADTIDRAVSTLSIDNLRNDENARDDAKEIAEKALADIQEAMAGFMS